MALRRVFVDSLDAAGTASVSGDRAHHLSRVVRLRVGETVEVSDGRQARQAQVETISPREVVFRVGERVPDAPSAPAIDLYLAVIKFPRWEWALEKVTELGARSIHPLAADHSEVGLVQAASKRLGRWRKIAEEAAQQSRRLGPPEVGAVITLAEAFARPAGARLTLDFEAPPLREALPAPVADSASSLALFVGPEGGWSDAERRARKSAGLTAASLGHNVLRAETAAVAAVALIAHLLEA